jgi:hypothetical protein
VPEWNITVTKSRKNKERAKEKKYKIKR